MEGHYRKKREAGRRDLVIAALQRRDHNSAYLDLLRGYLMAVSYTHLDVYKRQAQDPTAYGEDWGKPGSICELLDKLNKVPGLEWIRICLLYTSRCV